MVFENFVSEEHLKALNHEIEEHFRPLLAEAASLAASARENMKQFECDVISWSPFADGARAFLALRDDERLQ